MTDPARFVSRAYARLLAGQAASSLGDAVFTVAAVLWVDRDLAAGRPWAAAAVSGVPAAAYAAAALAGPFAGVVVDRCDRRTVMAATELARAGLAGVLAAVFFVPAGRLPAGAWLAVLYLAVLGLNGAGQFFAPARTAVIAAMTPGDADRARAAGLAEAAAAAAGMIGPLIAVPLMLTGGIGWALLIDAASYLASWLSVRALPPSRPAREGGGLRAELLEGWRAFRASRYLKALLTVTVTCQLGAGALTALNVLAVTGDLHGTARTYGVAEALMGAGYIAGAAAAGRLVRAAGPRAVVVAGLSAAAALTAGYAIDRDVPAGLALLAAYAAAIGLLNTAAAPILMGSVPNGCLGRVLAVFGPCNQAAGAVSVLGSGWLASGPLRGFRAGAIGPVSLLLLTGAALIVAAAVCAAAALPPSPVPRTPERLGEPAMTSADPPFSDEVAEYLAYCAEHARLLSPVYHPTADGAVKVIWHRGADQAAQIRAAFRAAAGACSTSAAGARAVTHRATFDLDAGLGEAG
jgi:MFS family permease